MQSVTFMFLSLFTTLVMVVAFMVCVNVPAPGSLPRSLINLGGHMGFLLVFLGWLSASSFIAWRYLKSRGDVTFSSTYFRSLSATVIFFLVSVLLMISGRGIHTTFTGYYGEQNALLGWAGLVMSFWIGTFSALSDKVWSWLRVSLLTLLGWVVALIAQNYVAQLYTR